MMKKSKKKQKHIRCRTSARGRPPFQWPETRRRASRKAPQRDAAASGCSQQRQAWGTGWGWGDGDGGMAGPFSTPPPPRIPHPTDPSVGSNLRCLKEALGVAVQKTTQNEKGKRANQGDIFERYCRGWKKNVKRTVLAMALTTC